MKFGLEQIKSSDDLMAPYIEAYKIDKLMMRDIVLNLLPKSLAESRTYDEISALGSLGYNQVRSATKQLIKFGVKVKSERKHNHRADRMMMHYWVES